MKKEVVCRDCGNEWVAKADRYGLFQGGRGFPTCPICGGDGCNPNDYADYTCPYCGHHWRQYGNGGLVLGCVPRCPECEC